MTEVEVTVGGRSERYFLPLGVVREEDAIGRWRSSWR